MERNFLRETNYSYTFISEAKFYNAFEHLKFCVNINIGNIVLLC